MLITGSGREFIIKDTHRGLYYEDGRLTKVLDAGRYRIVEARAAGKAIKLLVPEGDSVPEGTAHLAFDAAHTQVYQDGWMVGSRP